MAKAKARPKAKETPPDAVNQRPPNDPSPIQRMRDLTRRILSVPKGEAVHPTRGAGKTGGRH